MSLFDLLFFASAGFGFSLAVLQIVLVAVHRGPTPRRPLARPPISILKPLCGHDDALEGNLAIFAAGLDYPDYELLLGVESPLDPAFPLAQAAAERWPERVRVVVQRGAPGINPKVNQLLTLAAAARHEILVVSDSNVRVLPGYLDEIAALLADPAVGLVTHPVAGLGERDPGAAMDNLHMTVGIGVGTVGIKVLVGKDFVVGKSMALRREDLEALGGLLAYKDVIAEDHYLGKDMRRRLGKRVVFARSPVWSVVERRSARGFHERYQRWSVLQRRAVGPFVYATLIFSNPLFFMSLALAAAPSLRRLLALTVAVIAKMALDGAAVRTLRPVRAKTLLWVPIKDAFVLAAWLHGFVSDRIRWRDRALRVAPAPREPRAHGPIDPEIPEIAG